MVRIRKIFMTGLMAGLLILGAAVGCPAENGIASQNPDVKAFRLPNDMLFLIVERPATPQVACRIAIRAGSALETAGKTGVAHLLEHMLFKGTKNFGSRDYEKDRELQNRIEAAYQIILQEKRRRDPDQRLIEEKLAEMAVLRREVREIYVPQAFSAQLARNGAVNVNAFTTPDQTQYFMSVPSDMLEQWFSIASEQLFEPAWREFYVEKEVVKREWAYRYVNTPAGAAGLDLFATAFRAHPYRNPTIGWKGDIDNLSTTDAREFHAAYYNPSNTVCVLAGDVNIQEARVLAERYFGRYPKGRRAPEKVTPEPPQKGPRQSIRYLKGARSPLVRIAFHTSQMGTRDFYALDALTMILSYGRSARLTQRIVNPGLAMQAWSHHPDRRYGGMFILGGSPNDPAGLKNEKLDVQEKKGLYLQACRSFTDLLLAEINNLQEQLVSDREMKRIRKLNRRQFLDGLRSNENLAGTLANLEIEAGWRYLTDYLEQMEAVTAEDIRRAARKYFRPDNRTTIYIIPGGKPEKPPEAYNEVRSVGSSAAAGTYRPDVLENYSIYQTPENWRHPLSFQRKPSEIEYPSAEQVRIGKTTLFYLPDFELPLIDLTLLVKAGAVDLKEEQTGLAAMLESCWIRGGAGRSSPQELAMYLDENGINLSVSVNQEDTVIKLSVLKDDWEKGIRLLQDLLVDPRLAPEIFQAARERILSRLARQGENAQAVAFREGMLWHFKGHPYGRDPLIGLETVPNITREDLKSFLQTYFVPANMTAAVAGHIDRERVVSGLEKLFAALPPDHAPRRRLDDPAETGPVLALINKPGQLQSQVTLWLPSVKRMHPDYWKISLLTRILGGDDSLMYTRLRDELGLVYSAGFYQSYKWRAGMLVGYMGCKADKTPRAIAETLDIIESLRRRVPQEELRQKRLDALNSFVFNVDNPADLVRVYARYHMRREPLDTLQMIQEAYLRTTREELQDLARTYLDPRKIQIFVVADKNARVQDENGDAVTLENKLRELAAARSLPYRELAWR